MFIAIGLALYSLRRIRIIRAVGTLKNEDALRVVYKRVFNFQVDKPKVLLDMSQKNLMSSESGNSSILLHQESFHAKR